jgi:hypothetical protein
MSIVSRLFGNRRVRRLSIEITVKLRQFHRRALWRKCIAEVEMRLAISAKAKFDAGGLEGTQAIRRPGGGK